MKPAIKEIFWDPSPSQDVVKHRIHYEVGLDAEVTITSPFIEVPGDQYSARLDRIVADSGVKDDLVSMAVSAVDDAGWPADLYQHPDWVNVPFDVEPPAAVSGGGIRDSLT